jgi:ATP synthase protein I
MDDRADEDFQNRAAFEQRLAAAREAAGGGGAKKASAHKSAGAAQSAMELAMRLGVELVAAMVIAVAIGWGLDRLFHTKPWLMILMVPVGMAAGLRNLVRAVGPAQK